MTCPTCGRGNVNSDDLTRRERDVVRLVRDGLTNKEIARELGITTYTVKSHIHNVLAKRGQHSRMKLMVSA